MNRFKLETINQLEKLSFGTSTAVFFSISDLLAATSFCAVAIASVRHFGISGALALFVFTIVVCQVIYRRGMAPARRRFWYQVLWGVVMPVACIATDPLVFGDLSREFNRSIQLYSHAIFCYALIAWQIFLLGIHWFLGREALGANAWFMGAFAVGTTFCFALATVLLPLSALGLIVIIGVLGFTPWITGYIFLDLTMANMRSVDWKRRRTRSMLLATAGTLMALLIPFLASQFIPEMFPKILSAKRGPELSRQVTAELPTKLPLERATSTNSS